ncbi:unnamed protein product [Absidia cylindrospora]
MNNSPSSSSSSPPSVLSPWYILSLRNFKSICQIPPWISMETKLYDCWLCFYEPVFWIMYLLSNMLQSYKRQQQPTIDVMTFSPTDDDESVGRSMPVITESISAHSNSATIEDVTINTSEEEEEDEAQSIRSNKSFKHTLKGHFQMIRQKQQSLNEIMKRSILRKSSKSSLLQSSNQDYNSTIIMKPSISTSSTSSTSSSSSSSSSSSLSSSNFSFASTSPPSPIVFLSSPSYFVGQDQSHSDKTRPMHPLALERRPSISDSLLKSINKKRKQPATITTVTSSSNQYSNHYLNIDARKESSPYLDPTSSHLYKPSLPSRRKTSPEFLSLSKK